MLQRSGNHRKNQQRRRLIRRRRALSESQQQAVQELRQKRLKRYRATRALIHKRQLQRVPELPEPLPIGRSSRPSEIAPQRVALGVTHAKRDRQQRRAAQGLHAASRRGPNSRPRRSMRRTKSSPTLYLLRLGVAGLGVAVCAGILISILHPKPPQENHDGTQPEALSSQFLNETPPSKSSAVQAHRAANAPGRELATLKSELQALLATQSDLKTGLFFMNPESGEFVDIHGGDSFAAASTIKVPVLIAFFQDVDAGRIKLDEMLTMRKELIAGESGSIQYDPPGSSYAALEIADLMITISDNTATNLLIDRLGGPAQLNERFKAWGLSETKIENLLPDMEGTNKTSAKDLSLLMIKLSRGELLTPHSRDRALEIMRDTVTKTLLPQGLGPGAEIAHKTGDIGTVIGDVGLIDLPSGQRYVGTVLVTRPYNDPRARDLIQEISRLTYESFNVKVKQPTSAVPESALPPSAPPPEQTVPPPLD